MAREIIIDTDTKVGYDYQDSLYYVVNKNSKTTRRLASSIYKVLQIVQPLHDEYNNPLDKDNNPITIARLIDLSNTLERLYSLSYTMSVAGDYISSIQLNDYKDSPLILDLERFKIYIKGTNNIFDITLNEPIYNRIIIIRDYYIEHLGLELTIEQAYIIYGTLYNYYSPHLYNELTNKDEELYYSNIVKLSNPNKDSEIAYSIEVNPFNEYYPSYTSNELDSINSNRVFTIYANNIPVQIGQQIQVSNTYIADNENINSDGIYTVSGIEHGLPTYIKVKEQYIQEFKATYTSLTARTNILEVESINAEDNTITCTTHAPHSLLLGSTIYLEGTSIPSSINTITLDRAYTVKAVANVIIHEEGEEDKNRAVITVEEQLQQDYTPSQSTPIIYTNTILGNITDIRGSVVVIDKEVRIDKDTEVYIGTNKYLVSRNISSNNIPLTTNVTESTKYLPKYGTIQLLSKVENSKVIVTETNTEELPIGEFILDNYQETISYLKLGISNSNSDLVPSVEMLDKTNTIIDTTKNIEVVLVRAKGTHGEGMLFPSKAKAEEYISSTGKSYLEIISISNSLKTMKLIGLMVFVVE